MADNRANASTWCGLTQLVRRLRYRQLAVLVALGKYGNLHRAAEEVHVAQPSATKMLRELERVFGFRLFERLPRGMSPTELGTDVLTFARRALADLDRFTNDLDRKRVGVPEQLVIGTVVGTPADHAARAIAAMTQRCPEVSTKLYDATSKDLTAQLLAHEVDLAVAYRVDRAQRHLIAYENLGSEPLRLVTRTSHPSTRPPEAPDESGFRLRSLRHYPWILPPLPSRVSLSVEHEFAEAGLDPPATIIESASPCATLQIVLHSDAIAVLPESTVREHLQAGRLTQLPLALTELRFGILTRRDEPVMAAATEFIELLRRSAGTVEQEQRTDLNPKGTHPYRFLPDSGAASSAA